MRHLQHPPRQPNVVSDRLQAHRPHQVPQHVGSGYPVYHYPGYLRHLLVLCNLQRAMGGQRKRRRPGLFMTILLIVPIANLFSYWFHSFEYAEFIDNRYPGIAIFILWIVFAPVVWFLVQWDLNKAARRQG